MTRSQLLFSFNGRLTRKPFNFYNLAITAGSLLVNFVADPHHLLTSTHIAVLTYGLLVLWPSLAVAVKRFHDIGKNGWHLLLVLIPFLGPLWVAFDLSLSPSAAEPNQYGPPLTPQEGSVHEYTRPNTSPYFLEIALFGMLPLGLLWVMRVCFRSGNAFGAIMVFGFLVVIVIMFLCMRRRYFIKVILRDNGINLHGLARSVIVPWDQLQTVRLSEESFSGTIEILTRGGRFVIPATMRRGSVPFPKLVRTSDGEAWLLADGSRLPVDVRNSPLYRELKERISPNQAMEPTVATVEVPKQGPG